MKITETFEVERLTLRMARCKPLAQNSVLGTIYVAKPLWPVEPKIGDKLQITVEPIE